MKTTPQLHTIAERLMRSPAVPYHEQAPAQVVREICAENGLPVTTDEFGNLLVTSGRASKCQPLILAAHLDHPGFLMGRRLRDRVWSAEFLGGVGDSYFQKGVPVLLYPGEIKARLGRRISKERRIFEIIASSRAQPKFAVWDLIPFQRARDRITGRVCDDLIGAAAILAVLIALCRTKTNVIGVFSRAEEVGFHGALALADSGRLPRNGLIVSLETSRELPPVKMGQGVILRVGDRTSIFDSAGTRFLGEIASGLKKRDSTFNYQRALMSGGTCEGTAYQEFGYRCAAICVALGNYHNCGPNNRIEAEYVSEADASSMARLLVEAARQMPQYDQLVSRLPQRLQTYRRAALKKLAAFPLD